MLQMKQEALADALGDDWTQKKISLLESKETIEPAILEQVAKALNIPTAAIKNFDEQGAVTYFNTFNDNSLSNSNGAFSATQCTFNPIDKLIEAVEENNKLYSALLKEKDEKIALLEKMLSKK